MTDRTDERIRSVVVELAEHAPAAPTFDELEHLAAATTTEARPRRRGAVVVSLGLVLGIAGAAAVTRVLRTLLYGVDATDPPTFVTTAALLATVALLACLIPAMRAARVDPAVALRVE